MNPLENMEERDPLRKSGLKELRRKIRDGINGQVWTTPDMGNIKLHGRERASY